MIDPLVMVRAVHYAATVMVAGAVVFTRFVAEPAFQTVAAPPWRVIRPFRACRSVLLLVSLAAAVASGAGWLLLLAAAIDDRPLSDAVADGTAWIVLTQTRFGFDWQVRFLLAALLSTYVLLWSRPRLATAWHRTPRLPMSATQSAPEGAAAALLTGLPLLVPARDKITVKRRISSGSPPYSCGRGRLGR